MLDNLSGGRLIAGHAGRPQLRRQPERRHPADRDAAALRARARALLEKAWAATEPFAWNGKYSRYPFVNIWPRPAQQPRPPFWVPGSGTPSTLVGHPRPRGRLHVPELVRRDADGAAHLRPLLGARGREGPRPQPLPRRVPADGDGRGHRRGGRAALRRPRPAPLPQRARRDPAAGVRAARLRRAGRDRAHHPRPRRPRPRAEAADDHLPRARRHARGDLRRRRHGARADHRVRQGVPDRQPARDAAGRLDAARARAATTSTRSRRACCRTCAASGRTRGGSTAGGPPESASASATRSPPERRAGGNEMEACSLVARGGRQRLGRPAWTCT